MAKPDGGSGRDARMWAIAGPKGGSGKTLLASNLAILLARKGSATTLCDLATPPANMATIFGAEPDNTLSEYPNLALRPVDETDRTSSLSDLSKPGNDRRIFDLSAGINPESTSMFIQSGLRLLVTTPEPASIELCYLFIKNLFRQRLEKAIGKAAFEDMGADELIRKGEADLTSVVAMAMDEARNRGRQKAERALEEILDMEICLIINMARTQTDESIGPAICDVVEKMYGFPMTYIGHIPFDERVSRAALNCHPFISEHPTSETTACFHLTLNRLLSRSPQLARGKLVTKLDHYEILSLPFDASEKMVEEAYLLLTSVYSKLSPASYGAIGPTMRAWMITAIRTAYSILFNETEREEYDQSIRGAEQEQGMLQLQNEPDRLRRNARLLKNLPPTGSTATTPGSTNSSANSQRNNSLFQAGIITGAHLRNIRIAMGETLDTVADKTKVKKSYLEAIENDDRDNFPAPVFIRGFLKSYAVALGLNPDEISKKYLSRS